MYHTKQTARKSTGGYFRSSRPSSADLMAKSRVERELAELVDNSILLEAINDEFTEFRAELCIPHEALAYPGEVLFLEIKLEPGYPLVRPVFTFVPNDVLHSKLRLTNGCIEFDFLDKWTAEHTLVAVLKNLKDLFISSV